MSDSLTKKYSTYHIAKGAAIFFNTYIIDGNDGNYPWCRHLSIHYENMCNIVNIDGRVSVVFSLRDCEKTNRRCVMTWHAL